MTDWVAWHAAYGDPGSSLPRRLAVVRSEIGRWLDETAPRPVTVLSLCAGDGRDLLGALAGRADGGRVSATLVELDPQLCQRARDAARATAGSGIEVRCADAGTLESYAACPPADLVLACGVFGNVSDADVEGTIAGLPALCAEGARVVWTRHRREPDLTPRIREWFTINGFHEVAFITPEGDLTAIGVHDLVTRPRESTTAPGPRLFTFTR